MYDHKIQDMGVKNVINQYNTKSAISVFTVSFKNQHD